jgi:hypothetical protein
VFTTEDVVQLKNEETVVLLQQAQDAWPRGIILTPNAPEPCGKIVHMHDFSGAHPYSELDTLPRQLPVAAERRG